MNDKNEKYLYDNWPKLFGQKSLPMSKSCMYWGICVGDGWFNILCWMCGEIQKWCDQNNTQVEFTQIKEKFGLLRVYTNTSNDAIDDIIMIAEEISSKQCEICGRRGKLREIDWMVTLCWRCNVVRKFKKIKLIFGF